MGINVRTFQLLRHDNIQLTYFDKYVNNFILELIQDSWLHCINSSIRVIWIPAKVFITVLRWTSHLTSVRLGFFLHKMEIIASVSQTYIPTTVSKMTSSSFSFPSVWSPFLNHGISFCVLSLYYTYSLFTTCLPY